MEYYNFPTLDPLLCDFCALIFVAHRFQSRTFVLRCICLELLQLERSPEMRGGAVGTSPM